MLSANLGVAMRVLPYFCTLQTISLSFTVGMACSLFQVRELPLPACPSARLSNGCVPATAMGHTSVSRIRVLRTRIFSCVSSCTASALHEYS